MTLVIKGNDAYMSEKLTLGKDIEIKSNVGYIDQSPSESL